MYVDADYDDASPEEIRRLAADRPFATLITAEPELRVAHVPVQVRSGTGTDEVVGHVAAADPFAASLRMRATLIVVIHGPALYVSPQWYADRGLPTYNFAAVHLHGRAEPLVEPEAVVAHLMSLVADHERPRRHPWRMDGWARARTDELLDELQAFTMPVERVEAKFKMGQNRTAADRVGVMSELAGSTDECSSSVLQMMRQRFGDAGDMRPAAGSTAHDQLPRRTADGVFGFPNRPPGPMM
jgi:transcriptional regulator